MDHRKQCSLKLAKLSVLLLLSVVFLIPSHLLAAGTISGNVTINVMGSSEAAAGFEVLFLDAENAVLLGQTTTDVNGNFASSLNPGSYKIRFSGNYGYTLCAREYYGGGTTDEFVLGSPVAVTNNSTTSISVELTASTFCVVKCTSGTTNFDLSIKDKDTGIGISGIKFQFRDAYNALLEDYGEGNTQWSITDNGEGSYYFKGFWGCVSVVKLRLIDPTGIYLPQYFIANQSDAFEMGTDIDLGFCGSKAIPCSFQDQMVKNGATPAGSDVVVQPVDPNTNTSPVTLTFDNVTTPGETSITITGTGTPPPNGFKLGNPPVYYSVETTAGYTGSIQICINYSGISYSNENALKLFHQTAAGWEDSTTSLDTVNDIICGSISSLSVFGAFEEAAYSFLGFFPPLANPPITNSAKAGQTISVKWQLPYENGGYISDPAFVSIYYMGTGCGGLGTAENPVPTETSGESGLRYDLAANQFIYNWKTNKSWAGSCSTLILRFSDGSEYNAYFSFK